MPDGSQHAAETPEKYEKTALVADARELAATLEDAHPDPYAGHGGRVDFHRRLEELVRDIPEDGEREGAFARRLQRFVARVRDGHTSVDVPGEPHAAVDCRFPLDLRVVGDALYVDAVYEDDHADLLGGRLLAVNDVRVPALRERMAAAQSSDNVYGDRQSLCAALGPDPGMLGALLAEDAPTPILTVERSDGERVERTVDHTPAEEPTATLDRALDHPETSGEPAYRLLDGGDAALLTIPDCQTHREPIEAAVAMYDDLPDLYDPRETYRQVVGDPAPDDVDDVLAGIPAATAAFTSLAAEMAAAGTETLVVDTRGNGGGSSLPAYILAWVLYGSDGLGEAAADQYSVSKDSATYRAQYGDDGPLADTDNPAGFDFDSYFTPDSEKQTSILEELTAVSETFAAAVEDGEYDGFYAPEDVVVVTDAETFSAGVEPAVLLSKLGARVAGVPSAQAANGPRDVLFGTLSNTGIEFRTSFRYHAFRPGEDGTVFDVDVALTPQRFEAYDRTSDAGVRLALDAAAGTLPL